MCLVAIISFILAWKIPFFWLVFVYSLWVMARQNGQPRVQYEQVHNNPSPPRTEPPRQHTLYDVLEVSPNASPEGHQSGISPAGNKVSPGQADRCAGATAGGGTDESN